MAQKTGRHTSYFELVEAQGKAGCPICRLVHKTTDRYLDSILYEAVLDPDVRAKLKGSHGFCDSHVVMLQNKPGRALGIALIYRDIIRELLRLGDGERYRERDSLWDRVTKGRSGTLPIVHKLTADVPCPACAIASQAEETYLELMVMHLAEEDLYNSYAQGEGLCLTHLVGALERTRDERTFENLLRPQLTRYRLMLRDLDEFIRKRDHRFTKEEYGEEGDVWLRVLNAIVGGAGMGLSATSGGRQTLDL